MLTVPQNLSSGIIKPSSKFWIYLDAFCLLFFLGRTVSTSVRSSIFVGKISFFLKKKLGCVMYLVLFFYRGLRLIILIYSRKLTGGPWE